MQIMNNDELTYINPFLCEDQKFSTFVFGYSFEVFLLISYIFQDLSNNINNILKFTYENPIRK